MPGPDDETAEKITRAYVDAYLKNRQRDVQSREGRELIDRGNRDDLLVFGRLAGEHVKTGCTAEPLCPGRDVMDLIQMRRLTARSYLDTLALTAIIVLAEQRTEIEELSAQVMRLEMELHDAHGRLADADGHTDV